MRKCTVLRYSSEVIVLHLTVSLYATLYFYLSTFAQLVPSYSHKKMEWHCLQFPGNCCEQLSRSFISPQKGTVNQLRNIIPIVKHGGGSIMIQGSFAALGPRQLAIVEDKMNSQLYEGYRIMPG